MAPDPKPISPNPPPAGDAVRPVAADVDVFGLTDRGKLRKSNQDQFLIGSLHKLLRVHQTSLPEADRATLVSESRGYIFLVADGVGGRPDGAVASGTALRTIAHYVTNLTDLYRRLDSNKEATFLTELQQSVVRSHQVLLEEALRQGGGPGGATTLTMVAVLWPRAYLVQVGDSRCYRLRGGELERVSKDQTVAQALVDAGALSATEAATSPLRNVLSSALGGDEAMPQTTVADLTWDDVMLLCTDGLTRHVSDQEIEAELKRIQSAEQSCRRLLKLALERGGTDNVTVVIGRLRSRRSTPPA